MKKFVVMLGVITSALILVGCASKATTETAPQATTVAPAHHDYKGESSMK